MSKNNSDSGFREYREAVAFVRSFSYLSLRDNFGSKKQDSSFFLKRTRYFLDLLGSPDKAARYIHVTGTAGKGSVCSLLSSILRRSGATTGLFTSPFVTTTAEQIQVDGKYISAVEFVEIVDYLKPFIAKMAKESPYGAPAGFEILLTIALVYFQRQKCSWVVLEAGLGGRYDATNVIDQPAITAITNIDYDHTEILGKTLNKIAYDKAGIIKSGSSFFTSETRPALLNIFRKICAEKSVSFEAIPKQSSPEEANLALVKSICRTLNIKDASVESGIKETKLPCRFEIMSKATPAEPTMPTIILDGAHNRAKMRSTIGNLKKIKYDKLIVVLSISNTKRGNLAVIAPLARITDHFILTSTNAYERRSLHPKVLLPLVKRFKKKKATVEITEDCYKALERAKRLAYKISTKNAGRLTRIAATHNSPNDSCILVTGSFFLAGQLRYCWYREEEALRKRGAF